MVTSSIGKILVVDDEVELKNILVEALTSQGYEASGFTDGEQALGTPGHPLIGTGPWKIDSV